MSTKTKKVTYKNPTDENVDYLVPLQYDPDPSLSNRTKSSEKSSRKPPVGYYGSIYFLISILLYAGVPISQFIIGFIYIGRCTIRQFIFVYMILSGAFGIAFVAVGVIIYLQTSRRSSSSYDSSKSNSMILKILIPIFIVLFLFVIGWFIAGQVIVFEVKTHVELFDPDLPEYCHGNLYKAAYVLIFVDYLIILFVAIFGALSCVSPPDETKKTKPKPKRPIRQTRK
ncbi:unnamed protein product [Rotaria sp. Silwood2]|nr:unnamed protein product [Rotaria sp. Silwood2]CAF4002902.1 unnamed protein product [Rotaria sp. Silwood2]